MKIIIRVLSLVIIGFLISISLMNSINDYVIGDELEKTSSLAMSNTQIIMSEIIEDHFYKTNNARISINSNEEYLELYKDNLMVLINSDSEYEIKDYYADYNKGLLYVDIICRYKNLSGKEKNIEKKLLNIIDVVDK